MAVVWITGGAVSVAIALYLLWRRPLRCYLCSKRIRDAEPTAHYPIEGRRRVVCRRCDEVNLRLTASETHGR